MAKYSKVIFLMMRKKDWGMSCTPTVLTTWAILKAGRGQAKAVSSGITDKYMRGSGETARRRVAEYGKDPKVYHTLGSGIMISSKDLGCWSRKTYAMKESSKIL
jgi:hypothetical protein